MTLLAKLFSAFRFGEASYRGKPGMRAYAVGDVHGCVEHLRELLQLIEADVGGFEGAVYLIFLGDLIDRGPDSRGVIHLLLNYRSDRIQPVFLMGNHEEFLLRSLAGEANVLRRWLEFGGAECVISYGLDPSRLLGLDEQQAANVLRQAMPSSHIAFISGFADTFRFGDYLFVHAGIRPGMQVEQQESADLRWIRQPFLDHRGDYGLMVVHGHTVTDEVEERSNRIGIDTGAYQGGPLTALVVEGATRRYLSCKPNAASLKGEPFKGAAVGTSSGCYPGGTC